MRIIRKDFWGVKINLLPCEYYFHDGQHRASPHKESDDVGEEDFIHLVWSFFWWLLFIEKFNFVGMACDIIPNPKMGYFSPYIVNIVEVFVCGCDYFIHRGVLSLVGVI